MRKYIHPRKYLSQRQSLFLRPIFRRLASIPLSPFARAHAVFGWGTSFIEEWRQRLGTHRRRTRWAAGLSWGMHLIGTIIIAFSLAEKEKKVFLDDPVHTDVMDAAFVQTPKIGQISEVSSVGVPIAVERIPPKAAPPPSTVKLVTGESHRAVMLEDLPILLNRDEIHLRFPKTGKRIIRCLLTFLLTVTIDGLPTGVEVIRVQTNPPLEDSLLAAFKQAGEIAAKAMRFKPAKTDGNPVTAKVELSVLFYSEKAL